MRNLLTVQELVISDLRNRGCTNVQLITEIVMSDYFALQTVYTTREVDQIIIAIYDGLTSESARS